MRPFIKDAWIAMFFPQQFKLKPLDFFLRLISYPPYSLFKTLQAFIKFPMAEVCVND